MSCVLYKIAYGSYSRAQYHGIGYSYYVVTNFDFTGGQNPILKVGLNSKIVWGCCCEK